MCNGASAGEQVKGSGLAAKLEGLDFALQENRMLSELPGDRRRYGNFAPIPGHTGLAHACGATDDQCRSALIVDKPCVVWGRAQGG